MDLHVAGYNLAAEDSVAPKSQKLLHQHSVNLYLELQENLYLLKVNPPKNKDFKPIKRRGPIWVRRTSPKFNMEPENNGFQKNFPFPGAYFQAL